MTQSSSAQPTGSEVAWRPARKGRTLAQRRADVEHQIRLSLASQMALADLPQLRARLKTLHERYEQRHGKLTQQQLATRLKVPYRTLQSWVNGEVETDRSNYDKLARFYKRGLDDPAVTTNWILFGQQEPPKIEPPADDEPAPVVLTEADVERLKRIEEQNEEILERLKRLAPEPPAEDVPDALPAPEDRPPGDEDEGEASTGTAG